ncbi:hypothetical protein [Robiginitalea aurantiaca]|uniref:DUF4382 domain-containing protein n=1 Tax=Robiginitalea aurantiaca TaxID=3056915 RepID=A0ABT7WH42_9FLAO|nr:hypothetical protein [Robiginitalea aurantiaca]MDM9632230.1 hypothetical protein [Robiginitalea aurantiaca]
MYTYSKSTLFLRVSGLVLLLGVGSCKSDPKEKPEPDPLAEQAPVSIQVTTKSMEFYAPDTINSGWNTFVYENQSTEPHFILLDKYPEGITIENTIAEVAPAFEEGMSLIMEGKMEESMEAFGKLPEWFSKVIFSGGTGLISAGKTAVTTIKLEPGYYVMECYVRMPDGRFHTSMGMAKELIVRSTDSGMSPPGADMDISISSQGGINWNGQPKAGKTTFRVTYTDQVVHENFVGHDVNLVAMEPEADVKALEDWINWATPTGLMSSTAPDGFTFLGGTNDSPQGSTQYFEADLKPGSYVLISEVPNTSEKGMLKVLTVGN